MNNKRKCPFCGEQFTPIHGNQLYCSPEHKKFQKAANQIKLYGVLKDFRKGFLANYKLFERLLPKSGNKTFPLDQLKSSGFRPDCYFGAFINTQKETFYRVGEYHYRIFIDNQIQSIKILKH